MQIDIVLFPGFDELDAIAPYEVLNNASALGAEFQVRFVSEGGPGEIVGAHGARIHSHAAFDQRQRANLVVVPGGGWASEARSGVRAEIERGVIPERIAECYAGGASLAAVCTGTMLIAATGLMRDRAATTHHSALNDLAAAGAKLIRARVVDTGRIITSGGVTSGLDLALWLVERFAAPETAIDVGIRMEYERRGVVWRDAKLRG
jgi:transcriptional regulator GlxA family with amidase domain